MRDFENSASEIQYSECYFCLGKKCFIEIAWMSKCVRGQQKVRGLPYARICGPWAWPVLQMRSPCLVISHKHLNKLACSRLTRHSQISWRSLSYNVRTLRSPSCHSTYQYSITMFHNTSHCGHRLAQRVNGVTANLNVTLQQTAIKTLNTPLNLPKPLKLPQPSDSNEILDTIQMSTNFMKVLNFLNIL